MPTKTAATATDLARLFFDNIYRLHGLPDIIISDRDARFTGRFWKALWDALGPKLHMSTPYHPQTDGQTERANRTLEEIVRMFVGNDLKDWSKYLTAAEFAYNNSEQASTGFTPFWLNAAQHPATPASLLTTAASKTKVPAVHDFLAKLDKSLERATANIRVAQERQRVQADRHRREMRLEVGDEVLLSTGYKLRSKFIGPFMVSKVVGPSAYELDMPSRWRQHRVQNLTHLRLYHDPTVGFPGREPAPAPPLQLDVDPDEEYWEVEHVLSKRTVVEKGVKVLELEIKWKDFPHERNTFEPLVNLNLATQRWVRPRLQYLPVWVPEKPAADSGGSRATPTHAPGANTRDGNRTEFRANLALSYCLSSDYWRYVGTEGRFAVIPAA